MSIKKSNDGFKLRQTNDINQTTIRQTGEQTSDAQTKTQTNINMGIDKARHKKPFEEPTST